MDLRNGDCLEILKDIPSKSVDLVFADLPYGQVNCKWDCKIDLELLWKELLRIAKSDTTPFFFTCTTKFGYELITSNKKMFRYDLVWAKTNPCGFLQAKKQPMRKHEMVYVFYKKQPAYDISSHKHKFLKSKNGMKGKDDLCYSNKVKQVQNKEYDPPLPVSVIKEEVVNERGDTQRIENSVYGSENYKIFHQHHPNGKLVREPRYDPPLPGSVIKEEEHTTESSRGEKTYGKYSEKANREAQLKIYDPPLPVSVIKEDNCYNKGGKDHYEDYKTKLGYANRKNGESAYDPPLPVSVIKEEVCPLQENSTYGTKGFSIPKSKEHHKQIYDPALPVSVLKEDDYEPSLPHSLLEIKSIRLRQHSTAKPPDLMKWILKYYTKEGDMVLDPTMGSNPMGLACKEMNRNYIGIEKDPDIYKFACSRVE